MNYGKKKASQKQKKITSKSTMQGKRVGVRLFKAFLLCLLVVAVVGVIGGGLFLKKILDNTPDVSPADVQPKGFTTMVYADDNKTEIERFVASGSNRIYKKIDEVPKDLQHAFVAIEDERFYDHNGIDLQGIARAAVVGLTSGSFSEGASTITQQLIKNNVFPNFTEEKTFFDKLERKIQEQYLAVAIEKQMDKDTILESYMNTINLGQNCLGVQSASKRYFNKDVSELTLSESAVIAGITQNPSDYNPITNPELNAKRRDKVLKNMLDQGYIDQAAYDEAKADDVYSRIQTVNNSETDDTPYSYFVDALADQVTQDLIDQLGYTETQAYNAVYSGGLSIYSTQNLAMQQICDEEMNDDSNYPGLKEYGLDYALTVTRADGTVENYSSGHIKQYVKETYGKEQGLLYSSEDEARAMVEEWKATIAQEGDAYDEYINISPQPQASVTVMDQYTGQIKAMVGGRGAKTTSRSLNRAYTGSPRQPGSTFKILAGYAPALDSAGQTLATIIKDEPYSYRDGTPLKNASATYRGDITMREAIQWSVNVCAVKTIEAVTPKLGYDYCKEKFGITSLDPQNDVYDTLVLGGLSNGVYNYQLCAAYAAIANGGVYNSPTLYTKILDHDGNVLLEGAGESHTAIKDSTAALLTSAMETVVESGTGTACRLNNMPVAGKTGTTDSNKDLWFCGFTPYYTCAVWGGYDDNKVNGYDLNFRFRIWRGIMSRIHENLEYKDFEMPNSIEKKTVCTKTGKLAAPGCPSITEYFAKDTAPTESCPGHVDTSAPKENEEDDENTTGTPDANTTPTDPNQGNNTPTPPDGGGDGGTTPPTGGGDGGTTPPTGGGDGGGDGGGTTTPPGGEGGTTTPPATP